MAFSGWEKGWGEHSPPLPALGDRGKSKAEAKGRVKAQTGTSPDQQQERVHQRSSAPELSPKEPSQ